LFAAAQRGYMDIVKVLVDKGADLNFRDSTGKSALHVCIGANQYATVKMLLELGANTTGVDMRQIRFWSMSNISNRIDNLLKKFPPKPLRTSKLKRSPIEGSATRDALRADDKSAGLAHSIVGTAAHFASSVVFAVCGWCWAV